MKQGSLYRPLCAHGQLGARTTELGIFPRVKAQHYPGIQLGNVAVAVELRAIDIEGLAIGLNPFDRPGAGAKPQVFNHITEFFIALGRQFGHRHAFLYVWMIPFQLLELQGVARQRGDQLAEARMPAMQLVVASIQLLALGVVDAQFEGITVSLIKARFGAHVEVLKRLQPFKARQAAHHRQNARVKGAHHGLRLFHTKGLAPQGENFHELVDEVLARLTGEGHHRH